MSIIHEALKKADKNNEHLPKYSYTGSIEHTAQKKKKLNWGPVFILLVLVLITGPIVAPVFSSPFKKSGSATHFASAPAQSVPSDNAQLAGIPSSEQDNRRAQFGIEEAALSSTLAIQGIHQAPALKLSGLVYADSNSYCLINGRVIKQGDMVSGAKLVRITSSEVELDFQGQKIVLTI